MSKDVKNNEGVEMVFDDTLPNVEVKAEPIKHVPPVTNVRELAELVWEVQRRYSVMLHEFNDPHKTFESWDDAGMDEQDACIANVTQLIYGGPERVDLALEGIEARKDSMLVESYVSAKIYLNVIKIVISSHIMTDKEQKEVGKNWLH